MAKKPSKNKSVDNFEECAAPKRKAAPRKSAEVKRLEAANKALARELGESEVAREMLRSENAQMRQSLAKVLEECGHSAEQHLRITRWTSAAIGALAACVAIVLGLAALRAYEAQQQEEDSYTSYIESPDAPADMGGAPMDMDTVPVTPCGAVSAC